MADPAKPWRAEYSKSSRAHCKTCSNKIGKDELRLGRLVQSKQFDGFMPLWHHAGCLLKKPNNIKSVDDVEGFDSLRWEDQKKLQKYVEGGAADGDAKDDDDDGDDGNVKPQSTAASSSEEYAIESAKSSRSSCKICKEKIMKGIVRVSTLNNRAPTYRHVKCFLESGCWKRSMEEMPGWDDLSSEDQKMVQDVAKPILGEAGGKGSKRKSEAVETDGGKKQKKESEDDNAAEKKELEKKLERQSKALWSLMDDLKKNVSTAELKEMLIANDGDPAGSENELRERCADGMMFGALNKCPQCNGPMAYRSGKYQCKGYISEWSRCNYTTAEVERVKGKWKVPEESGNAYLLKWYKSQKKNKESRILRPQSAKPVVAESDSSSKFLKGLDVFLIGKLEKTHDEWTHLIEEGGGTVRQSVTSGATIVTTEAEVEKENSHVEHARALGIPIVGEKYLIECMKNQKKLPPTQHLIEPCKNRAVKRVKVKGRSAVHDESDMQEQGHILEVGKTIYNVTLNMSDLSTGLNSYYILQIIEEDKSGACYIFRRWGRVGDSSIGGKILQEMSKEDAIRQFERLFAEKTGNDWESWLNRDGFEKKHGKFYPLDIDYGVEAPQKELAASAGSRSKLHPRVVSLLKMLFDIETYKSAMLEFEINPSEMPLGKLTKRHIAKGFEVLTEIQNILNSQSDGGRKQVQLFDASNRFNTLIPAIHPSPISDEEALKVKIQMLEALRDIEIASQLISAGEEDDEIDPLDSNYKKLNCDISPLPHDGPEFKLVKKYLDRTHAPTHTEWALELEDVFVVRREGEHDKYAPMKSKMDNHMLLWHGSRTTNFVGILSQGLRIAPPEAPVTGYMFGKGVYFADLVSKSAQYCYTSRANPVGLMLLSEVALGRMKEYTRAQYMEKPPDGYNSTKGVGRTKPQASEFEVLDNDVVVPCGRPVPAGASSDLMYNEYIVYDTSQVELRFLLKVRFKHKRY